MPEAEPLGRSVSCEDNSTVGGVTGLGPLNQEWRRLSASSSDIKEAKNWSDLFDNKTSYSSHNLLGPSPFVSIFNPHKKPTWSPVKFVPKPLPDSRKSVFNPHTVQAKILCEEGVKEGRRQVSGTCSGFMGTVPTSKGGTKLAVVAPMNSSSQRLQPIAHSSHLTAPSATSKEAKFNNNQEYTIKESSSKKISLALQKLSSRTRNSPPLKPVEQTQATPHPAYTHVTYPVPDQPKNCLNSDSQLSSLHESQKKAVAPDSKNLQLKTSPSSPVKSTLWKPNRLQASSLSLFEKLSGNNYNVRKLKLGSKDATTTISSLSRRGAVRRTSSFAQT
ncbi:hypothetical protein SK128_011429 [Halocaridina rubra]|uniref:Uncharacterized protein n=1 Tax=Halocaridina rubra TaxID=373956 RepID=A0AAN8XIR4_HALRR